MTGATPRARWVEPVAALLMALATLGTAWSSYESAAWTRRANRLMNEFNSLERKAGLLSMQGLQTATIHTTMFMEVLAAQEAGNEKLASFYVQRFPPDLRKAYDAWLAQKPFENPNAESRIAFVAAALRNARNQRIRGNDLDCGHQTRRRHGPRAISPANTWRTRSSSRRSCFSQTPPRSSNSAVSACRRFISLSPPLRSPWSESPFCRADQDLQRILRVTLKGVHHIGDGGKAVDATELRVHAFTTETVPHRGVGFDCLDDDTLGSAFAGQFGQHSARYAYPRAAPRKNRG